MITIYALTDPRDGSIRYIGQTEDIERRLGEHINTARVKSGSPRQRWVADLLAAGHRPMITALMLVADDEADAEERKAIEAHVAAGCPLTNVHHVAQPTSTVVVSVSLPAEVADRLDAFAKRVGLPKRSNGEPPRGTAGAMLIARGLDAEGVS